MRKENVKTSHLLHLSTTADSKISDQPWVKFQSAGWVNIQSAPTLLHNNDAVLIAFCVIIAGSVITKVVMVSYFQENPHKPGTAEYRDLSLIHI